jgi:hypothetical protein
MGRHRFTSPVLQNDQHFEKYNLFRNFILLFPTLFSVFLFVSAVFT